MTAPLTPPDCDLQDFPFMPLHVARLRDSDLAAEEAPEACWYAVLLWAASWHQIPAGSLPDNDAVLTKLIGLGRDVRTFRKHKAGAMRGFVLCDDGRLYHPIVAEQVLESWRRKLEQRWRTECARVKKANQRNGTELPTPTFEAFMASLPDGERLASVPEDGAARPQGQPDLSPGTAPPCPSGNGLQETGIGTETGTERILEERGALVLPLEVGSEAASPKRGCRLPPDWRPSADLIAFALREGFTEREAEHVAAKFRDFWTAKAGKDGVKLDWPATWRNWVRNEAERRGVHGASPRPNRVTFV
jgi:hypothetical protein